MMDKRELINEIMRLNQTARPEFLAGFKEEHLTEYLRHLVEISPENKVIVPVFSDLDIRKEAVGAIAELAIA